METYWNLSPEYQSRHYKKQRLNEKLTSRFPFSIISHKKPAAITPSLQLRSKNVPLKINLVSLTIPPTFGAEIASCMVLLCMRDIFFPERRKQLPYSHYSKPTYLYECKNDRLACQDQ